MTKFDKITERHFARVVEIIINGDNEFCDIGERMAALTSRAEIWCNEMADAQHEGD